MGIELITGSGLVLGLTWAIPGHEEGLLIGMYRTEDCPPSELIDLTDMSGHEAWSAALGRLVDTVAISFHVHWDDATTRPWALRIGVSGGAGATVALGEARGHDIRYVPNNLVVIFDESVARAYEIPSSSGSAWGELIG